MAKTLEDLEFDVILDTNISNRGGFIKTIREFVSKRPDYDVVLFTMQVRYSSWS